MSQTYLLSLVTMATVPVLLLGYFWVTDQYRQFEEQSEAWRASYIEGREQLLKREVLDAINYMEFQRSELDQSHREQLKLQVDNGVAQLDSLLREAAGVPRRQMLQRARDLFAPIRFGGGHDHYFIHTLDGTAVLMPAYPDWQGRDISAEIDTGGLPFVERMAQLVRSHGEGFLHVWYDKPASEPGAYLTVQYVRYYAPLDIYLGAVGYVDDRIDSAQQEALARFTKTGGDDTTLSVLDRNGITLLTRHPYVRRGESLDQMRDGDGQPLGPLVRAALERPEGDFIRFTWRRADGKPTSVIGYVRSYPGWQWTIGAGFLLDKLEATIAEQRAALQHRVHQRLGYFALIVVGVILASALAAQRLAQRTRRSLQSFAGFFADASKNSSAIDTDRLAFVEFEQFARDANRMIEQRSRMERALRFSEKRFELALSAAASHLWDLDLLDRTVVVSGSLFQQLGYSNETRQVTPDQWHEWLHPDDLTIIQRQLSDHQPLHGSFGLELRMRDSQGGYRWFNCRGGVVESAGDGSPLRALGTATEITVRKRMEQDLIAARIAAEDASHAKSQFLSSISHELRTPLNGVLGYAQILLRDQSTSHEQRNNLRAIENCGQHLLTLINDVLDLAKIESGKIEVQEDACDLHHLLESVSAIISERAESKGLSYQLEIDPQVPVNICIDEVKLRQILVNLLGNAVKFTHEGGITLRVCTRNTDTELYFQVCDTGIGINPDKHGEIFQPFHQLGSTAGGTGLGLPISQRLCEAMGGALSVQSAAGAGSCFNFHLPLQLSASMPVRPPAHARQQVLDSSAGPVKVMVVDDNPINRQVLAGMLRVGGIELVEAENGLDALEKLREQPVPLVLMDVRMPVMDGFTATRAIKNDPLLRDTVIIAVSASVFPEVVEGMREHGCDDFISKPVRVNELMAKISQYLRLPLRDVDAAKTRGDRKAVACLPEPLLTALRAAVAVGDIEAARAALQPLYTMAPDFVAFAEHVAHLLDNFEIELVVDLLTPLRATA